MENKIVNAFPAENLKCSYRKENGFAGGYKVIALDDKGQFVEVVDCRFYQPRERVYCCLWVHGGKVWAAGSDYADGCGYHKASAAADGAIKNAGYILEKSIDGVGDAAIESALTAIAKYHGFNGSYCVRFHP